MCTDSGGVAGPRQRMLRVVLAFPGYPLGLEADVRPVFRSDAFPQRRLIRAARQRERQQIGAKR